MGDGASGHRRRWVALAAAALSVAGWVLAGAAGTSGAQGGGIDLAITSVSPSYAPWSNSLVRVDVGIANQGSEDAPEASVTFTPPPGVTLVAASIATVDCDAPAADGSVRCSRGALGAGVSTSASVTAVNTGLPGGSDVTLSITLASTGIDADPSNNTRLVPLLYDAGPIPTAPGVATAQLILGPPVISTVATLSSFTIDLPLFNAGPADAANVRVVFALSAGLTPLDAFISAATPPCPFDAATLTVTCSLPRPVRATSQESVHLQVSSTAPEAGVAPAVTVTVLSDTLDAAPADNSATIALPGPTADQRATPPTVAAGAALPFTGRRTEPIVIVGLLVLGTGCCLLAPVAGRRL
ncbi:MAG: hypothetical protein AB7W59_16340 [Acidimicrobiia bacterium]